MNELARDVRLDFLRVFCVVGVIAMHTIGIGEDFIASLIAGLFRATVPLLVLLSGYLLSQKMDIVSIYYKKRLFKVVIPGIIAIVVYSAMNLRLFGWRIALEKIVFGYSYYHLWFLYMIIGIYLLLPLLVKVVGMLQFSYSILLSTILVISGVWTRDISFGIIPYSGYAMLGVVFKAYEKKIKSLSGDGLSIAFLLCVAMSMMLNKRYFSEYHSVNMLIASASLFSIFLAIDKSVIRCAKIWGRLSRASYVAYLSHPLNQRIVDHCLPNTKCLHNKPMDFVLVVVLSFAIGCLVNVIVARTRGI